MVFREDEKPAEWMDERIFNLLLDQDSGGIGSTCDWINMAFCFWESYIVSGWKRDAMCLSGR